MWLIDCRNITNHCSHKQRSSKPIDHMSNRSTYIHPTVGIYHTRTFPSRSHLGTFSGSPRRWGDRLGDRRAARPRRFSLRRDARSGRGAAPTTMTSTIRLAPRRSEVPSVRDARPRWPPASWRRRRSGRRFPRRSTESNERRDRCSRNTRTGELLEERARRERKIIRRWMYFFCP